MAPTAGGSCLGYALCSACFLFGLSLFEGCRHFWRRFLTPGLLAGVCHWSLLSTFSDLCRSVLGRESGLGPGNTSPSEHVVTSISEAQLLSGRLVSSGRSPNSSGGFSASNYRSRMCRKGRLRLLLFPAAPVVGGVVTPAAAAFELLFRGRALT
jgi:hypothetical protein